MKKLLALSGLLGVVVIFAVLIAISLSFMGCPPVEGGPTTEPTPSNPPICTEDTNTTAPDGESMLYTISDTPGSTNQIQDYLYYIAPNGKTVKSISLWIKIDGSFVGGTKGFKGANTGIINDGWDAASSDFLTDGQWHLFSRTIVNQVQSWGGYGVGIQLYNDATPTGPSSISDVTVYVDNFVVNYTDCTTTKYNFNADGTAVLNFSKKSDSGTAVSTLTWTGGILPTPVPFCGNENLTAPSGGSMLYTITSDATDASHLSIQDYLYFVLANPTLPSNTISSVSFYFKIDSSMVGETAGFKGINTGIINSGWDASWSALPTNGQWTKFEKSFSTAPAYAGAGVGFQLTNDNAPTGPSSISNILIYIDNFVINYTDCTTSEVYQFTTDDGSIGSKFAIASDSGAAVAALSWAP
jgi:hypothetical protein